MTAADVSLCEVELITFPTLTFGAPSRNLSRLFNTAGYVLVTYASACCLESHRLTAVTCVLSSPARQISSRNPACLRSMGTISLSSVWVKSFRVFGFKEIESVRENMGNLLKGWGC